MDIDVFARAELPTVLRALRTALEPAGTPLQVAERRFLETFARITGHDLSPVDPEPIAAREIVLDDPHRRKRLVQLAALAVLLARPVKSASVAFLQDLSCALGVRDGVVDVVAALRRGQLGRVRIHAGRRAFGALAREAAVAEGPLGIVRFFAALLFRARVNREKLWAYKRLGLLPEGTLGREYWKHLTALGFGFPGEPGGIPDAIAYHDVGHVLTGHDTSPAGEILQASFQAGSRRRDGFFFVQFAVLQFHHGVRITPVAPPDVGLFDPEKVLWAIHCGARCAVDITHRWDFWPLMPLPLMEARQRCGIGPTALR